MFSTHSIILKISLYSIFHLMSREKYNILNVDVFFFALKEINL